MPAADIVYRYPAASGSAVGNLSLRYQNTSGAAIASAADLDNGQAIAGVYTLTFDATAGTVDVVADDGSKNPNHATGVAVVADDVTVNYGIVLGAGIVIASTYADGNISKVSFGAYMTGAGATTDQLNAGAVESGEENPTEIEIAAVNAGDRDAADCEVAPLPGFYFTPADARAFVLEVDNHSTAAREKLATSGTKTITFQNWAAGPKTADVYVNGQLCIASAIFDGATRYEYGDGHGYVDALDLLKGLSIVFQDQSVDPTSTTITLIVDGDSYAWAEVAPDVSGQPGSWSTGPVTLTEPGEGDGIISQGGEASFWYRLAPPVSAVVGDLRLINLRTRGATI